MGCWDHLFSIFHPRPCGSTSAHKRTRRNRWHIRTSNKAVPRIEGAEKVSGKMRYAADIRISRGAVGEDFAHFSAACAHSRHRYAARRQSCRACARSLPAPTCRRDGRPTNERHAALGDKTGCVTSANRSQQWRRKTMRSPKKRSNLIDVQYEELPFVTDPARGDSSRRAGAARQSRGL